MWSAALTYIATALRYCTLCCSVTFNWMEARSTMTLQEAVVFATRVAFSMSKDPEVESIANMQAWYAMTTYNPAKGPLDRWIARLVRQGVWAMWRKQFCFKRPMEVRTASLVIRIRRLKPITQSMYSEQDDDGEYYIRNDPEAPKEEKDLPIPYEEYRLLYEHHIDRFPLDVLAKHRNVTVSVVKCMIDAAERRLRDETVA